MSDDLFLQTSSSLLSTLQLADSLFPSGRYTLSHGLEMFVESQRVHDAATLEPVMRDYVLETVGHCEAVAVANTNQAASEDDFDTIAATDNLLHAMRLPYEVSAASLRTGRQLINTSKHLVASDVLNRFAEELDAGNVAGSASAVFGVVSFAFGMDARTAVLTEMYSYSAAMIGAALRLMRLDYLDAQAILLRLQPDIGAAAERALRTHYEDMQAFAPTTDIMQMHHERSRMRMFAN